MEEAHWLPPEPHERTTEAPWKRTHLHGSLRYRQAFQFWYLTGIVGEIPDITPEIKQWIRLA